MLIPAQSPQSRHTPLSSHYRLLFGCKVYKVAVSVAQTCPNRSSRSPTGVCIFCDEWGSAAYPEQAGLSLSRQIQFNSARIRARYGAEKFLVYFQAYTNTFGRIDALEAQFDEALAHPDVVGLVLGTRPDCLPSRMVSMLARFAERTYLSVELGIQSLDDGQLRFLSRGHDAACSLGAIAKLRQHPNIEVCAHLMFGIPGEREAQLAETAACFSEMGVAGVKLHNLHVLRNTPLGSMYEEGNFTPISLPRYADRVIHFLEHLSPRVAIHRLNAVASRWDDVLAPDWARKKLEPSQFILDLMVQRDTWQGRLYPGARTPGAGYDPAALGLQRGCPGDVAKIVGREPDFQLPN